MIKHFFLCLFLLTLSLEALPFGNPWNPSLFCKEGYFDDSLPLFCNHLISTRIGYVHDGVINRHMEVDQHENHSSIHLFEMQTDSGEIVFNYRNRLDIFATFGVSSFMIETPQTSFSGTGPTQLQAVVRIETDTDFSWSVGSRGRIWSCRNFALAGEAQYFAGKSSISTIDNPFASEFVTYSKLANLKYQEWQFGLGASYQICLSQSIQALPYIGLTCSHAWVNMGRSVEPIDDDGTPFSFITLHNLSNQKVVGYAVGVTLAGSECFQFTLENRFASENAIYFNAEVKF